MTRFISRRTIESLCLRVTSGGTPSRDVERYWVNGTIPWFKTGELKDAWLEEAEETITEEALENSSAKVFPANTVLMAMYGDGKTITSLGILRSPAATNQASCAMIADPSQCDYRFLFYTLKKVRGALLKLVVAGAQRNLSSGIIKAYKIDVPSLSAQRAIVGILSAYDDLIEGNRRRITLLEEAARMLYREWFVHFRFPAHEHVKIIDGIPEAWERRTLIDLAEIVMGQSPESKYYNETGDGLPFHQGVTDYGFRFVTHRTYSTAVTRLGQAGDILLSVRAPVGRVNLTRDNIVLGRGLSAVRSRSGQQSFLFYALKNHFYAEDIIGTGSIYAATNKKELEGQLLVVPSQPLRRQFEDQASMIDRQIGNLSAQVEKLAQARDLLLPRLMNGEIAV